MAAGKMKPSRTLPRDRQTDNRKNTMNALSKALVVAVITGLVGAVIYEARQAAQLLLGFSFLGTSNPGVGYPSRHAIGLRSEAIGNVPMLASSVLKLLLLEPPPAAIGWP